ncbi:hypothetical protein OG2516_04034 [Oceanicola granulosus HTCC2516]|uniref:Uncharacterized protein n=1 Tax=Oceanicola granulosus (strain ATCC BAA-861 / DSM 15982 / KCTC 12143 / HTCC2516) TaxID=314256 RepID=Q2CEG2_OCEGH|nr:hypothetical protein [Oceanicola granulosus]EAR51035.1 hypothetical protein OG2516_04034 [Oceanicola granulosus HTCC2516]
MSRHNQFYSSETQAFWAAKALVEGRTISHKTEIREVRGWRLAAICERLRKRYGWPIEVDYRGAERFAYYRLKPGTDLKSLRYPPSAKALASGPAA